MKITFNRTAVTSGAAITSLAMGLHPLAAQETDIEDPFPLGEIILNARKIDEPLQRIPFGVSILMGAEVEDRRVREAQDLSRVTPGLNLGDTGLRGSNIPNIRGVGSFFPQSADDASVPVFIDGIPTAVRSQDRAFFDAERIEVLRGPQNTLYGRNAQAGAINVFTRDPTFEPEFELGFEIGEDGYRRIRGVASGPLSDTVAARIAGQFQTTDGTLPNVSAGALGEENLTNLSTKLLWQPSDATEVRFALRYGRYDEAPTQGVLLEDASFPRAAVETAPDYLLETYGFGLTVEHDLGDVRFTSVTGVQRYTARYSADDSDGFIYSALTGLPRTAFDDPDADFRVIEDDDLQFSQEIRFDGTFANGGNWVFGVNAFTADLDLGLTFDATGFIRGDFANTFRNDSLALFGEVTYPLSGRLNVIAGLRYTVEEKSFTSDFTDRSGGTLGQDASDAGTDRFGFLTGRVGLTYDITPDITAFGTIARGAKSGGFQLADTDLQTGAAVSRYETAFTWTAEAGIRGTVMGDRLSFAGSVFFNDTSNEHLQVFDLTTFEAVIENADTQTYGLELEAVYQATPAWQFEGAIAFLETEITRSPDPTVSRGNDVPFAPKVSFSLAAQHESDLRLMGRDGILIARAEYQFVGSRTIDPQNRLDLDAYGIVDLRLGWQSGPLDLYAFVENAFDETYAESAFNFGATPAGALVTAAVPGSARRIGVGATFRF